MNQAPTPVQTPPVRPTQNQTLNIQTEFDSIRNQYQNTPKKDTAAVICYGESGTGKTTLLGTCPGPILLYMFDPGGEKVLRTHPDKKRNTIDNGGVLVIDLSAFDPKDPKTWVEFERRHATFKQNGLYKMIGTVAVDSLTTASAALMSAILKKNGRAGGTPQLQDYMVQMMTLKDIMRELIDQPCHTIFLAHVDVDKDENTGRIVAGPLVTGKLKAELPLLTDELWVTQSKQVGADKNEYSILTQNDGFWKARTRIGFNGIFSKMEEPNFKALLKKAGYNAEDKDLHFKKVETQPTQTERVEQ